MPSGSATLNALREFNRKNAGNLDQMSEYMKKKKEEMDQQGSDSDEFESELNDSQCDSYHSSDEEMEDLQKKDTP